LELLCGLLHCTDEEQFVAAQWRPRMAYKAARIVSSQPATLSCGPNPFLVARFARKVRLDRSSGVSILKWQDPDCLQRSAKGDTKRKLGEMRSAPLRLTWRVHASSRVSTMPLLQKESLSAGH
jgi:hypothetical protein